MKKNKNDNLKAATNEVVQLILKHVDMEQICTKCGHYKKKPIGAMHADCKHDYQDIEYWYAKVTEAKNGK